MTFSLITSGNYPMLLVEAKLSDAEPAKSLLKFQSALNVPAVQLVNKPNIHKQITNHGNRTLITTASQWLATLP